MQRPFASLSPQEALGIAISIEERNAEIYHRFAEVFTEFADKESLEIASVFWEMAVEERGHHAMLEGKYWEHYGVPERLHTEDELVELIEVPRLDLAEVLAVDNGVPLRQHALQVALYAEVSAQQFYRRLVEQTSDSPLRQTYLELAEMEDGHVAFLQSKLTQDETEKPIVQ
jgi:erythrin-vacuolar iron transport family protein